MDFLRYRVYAIGGILIQPIPGEASHLLNLLLHCHHQILVGSRSEMGRTINYNTCFVAPTLSLLAHVHRIYIVFSGAMLMVWCDWICRHLWPQDRTLHVLLSFCIPRTSTSHFTAHSAREHR